MSEKRNNTTGYSITRSYKPLLIQSLSLVFISDVLFLALILLIVGIRNALGLDAELVGFTLLLFTLKTVLVTYSLYMLIKEWLGVSYYVTNNQLYIQSEIRSVDSSVIDLKKLGRAVSSTSYKAHKRTDYGNVTLEFAKGASTFSVVLKGVNNPDKVANNILSGQKS